MVESLLNSLQGIRRESLNLGDFSMQIGFEKIRALLSSMAVKQPEVVSPDFLGRAFICGREILDDGDFVFVVVSDASLGGVEDTVDFPVAELEQFALGRTQKRAELFDLVQPGFLVLEQHFLLDLGERLLVRAVDRKHLSVERVSDLRVLGEGLSRS